MKKRMLASVVCLAMLLSLMLSGCGGFVTPMLKEIAGAQQPTAEAEADTVEKAESNGKTTVKDNRGSEEAPEEKKEKPASKVTSVSEEDFEVKEYLYEDTYSSMCFVVVTNNSEAVVSVSGNGTAKNAEGGMIGADDLYIDVLGPGETSISYFYFSDVKDIDSVDYTLDYDVDQMYEPIIADLKVEQTLNNRNVIVTAYNEGDTCAEFVEAYALFFDAENNLIGHASRYMVDVDDEIKPGKSNTVQLECMDSYDHVEVYLVGRSSGKAADTSEKPVTDDDFDYDAYLVQDEFSTRVVVVATNNSDMVVGVHGSALVKDKAGNLLGADDMTIDVIGPGESTVGEFFFMDVTGDVDSVEYEMEYDTEPYAEPCVSNLAVEQTINSSNVIVAVTNNGTVNAEFVQAYLLLFDASGNLVGYTSRYVTDDDSEIKAGKTVTEQINVYTAFSTAEVYLGGRAAD